MKTTDFEKWLEDVCFEQNPMVLDDDMPDFFDDLIGNLSSEDFIAYANEYAKQDRHTIYTALRERVLYLKEVNSGLNPPEVYNHAMNQFLTLLDELFGVSKSK